jgi:hypothetical protein
VTVNIPEAKEHARELLDQLDAGQLAAVVQLLEVMADPVARSLANAPVDIEPVSSEEVAALDEAHAAIARGEGSKHEEILREFGLS